MPPMIHMRRIACPESMLPLYGFSRGSAIERDISLPGERLRPKNAGTLSA